MLSDVGMRVCQDDGEWSGVEPVCNGMWMCKIELYYSIVQVIRVVAESLVMWRFTIFHKCWGNRLFGGGGGDFVSYREKPPLFWKNTCPSVKMNHTFIYKIKII